jgi:glycosyltransferase involved in cell wall biosynthesis
MPNVTMLPRDHDVRNVFGRIDALLVPSLSESFCRIAAEAMLNRLPVVASDLPAIREVCGGDGALFFTPGSADAAVAQVERLVTDPALESRLVEEGLRRAQRFAPDVIAMQLVARYRSREGALT